MPGNRRPDMLDADILAMVAQGIRQKDIAAHFGVAQSTIGKRIAKHKTAWRTWRRMSAQEIQRVMQLHRAGMSGEAIAREIGRDGDTVRRWIDRIKERVAANAAAVHVAQNTQRADAQR